MSKPSSGYIVGMERLSSTDSSTVVTATIPKSTSYVMVTVETTAARITLNGSDPSAGSAPSHVLQKDAGPVYLLVGSGGTTIKAVSTAGTASVVMLSYYA